MTGIVVPFIGKAHGDSVVSECPDFLDQPIVKLAIPFAREKRLDFLAAMNEFGAVSPNAVGGIGKGYASGVAGIPGIFGEARLLRGGFGGEGRQWWATHELAPSLFALRHVRFTPNSGLLQCSSACPLWANSGHRRYSITSSARESS